MKTDKEKLTMNILTAFEVEYHTLTGHRSATVQNTDQKICYY